MRMRRVREGTMKNKDTYEHSGKGEVERKSSRKISEGS